MPVMIENSFLSAPLEVAKPPLAPTPPEEIVAALRSIEALQGLSDEEYLWLVNHGTERKSSESVVVFAENEPSYGLFVILCGEILVHRRNAGSVVSYVGRAYEVTGKLPYSRMKGWAGEGCSSGPIWLLDVHESHFPEMLQAIPSMGQRCVAILLDRVRDFTHADQQAEKLVALGKLAANLSHELKNPASAARGAALSLTLRMDRQKEMLRLGRLFESDAEMERYIAWADAVLEKASSHEDPCGSLLQSDHEQTLNIWLETHSVASPWSIAPALSEAGIPVEALDELAAAVGTRALGPALASFTSRLDTGRLIGAISDSSARIFNLIDVIKDYSYMDQAPIQEIDLARSLESTLALLNQRLSGIEVIRDFNPSVPVITAYGAELSLVWTALVENAIEAMNGSGTLKVATRRKGTMVFVEVWDDGPGIAPVLATRIFEPFFTTKPLGQGLGLGLDLVRRIVSKHFGSVDVQSVPRSTCFQVRLPLDRPTMF